jgi:serine/threonine protein kinase
VSAPANASSKESLVGAILSRRFRLTRELGRGGMGAVYAASPVDRGPAVAIKILHAHFASDAQVLARFLEEGRTYMRLMHANILRAHECLTAEDGSPYLVMDLLEGVPLSAYTRNGGRVSVAHAVPILQGILAGLEAAHETGIVHRDLKPANVFLARDRGGLFAVKLLDFGIAKVMEIAGGMGKKTRTGALLGTPAYMSPEQIQSAKSVDRRSDLWSAGVMFYEMLTGRAAFPAPTEYARLAAVLQSTPDPIERIDPQLAALGPFLARALQKDPGLRFQTAREMAKALVAAAAKTERQSLSTESASRVLVAPLSRLPEHPWLGATGAVESAVVAASPWEPPASPPTEAPAPIHVHTTNPNEPEPRNDDTLASAATPGAVAVTPPLRVAPGVPFRETQPEAIPLKTLAAARTLPRRKGMRPPAVVVLVLLALIAGLAVGYAFGHGLLGAYPR